MVEEKDLVEIHREGELVTQARLVPRFLLPSPSSILAAGIQFREVLVADAGVTTGEILLGFVAGSLVGLLLAIGIVFSRMIEQIVYPPAIITQVVPKLAVAPLFVGLPRSIRGRVL